VDYKSLRRSLLSDPSFLPADVLPERSNALLMAYRRMFFLRQVMQVTDSDMDVSLRWQILTRSVRAFHTFYLTGEEIHLKKLAADVADILLFTTCMPQDGHPDF